MNEFYKYVDLAIRYFSIPANNSEIIDTDTHTQMITSSVRKGPINIVMRSNFLTTNSEEVNEQITRVLEPYQRNNSSCWWIVGPSTRPTGFDQILEARGLKLDHTAWGLIHHVVGKDFSIQPNITIERVTESSLDDYLVAALDGKPPNEKLRTYFTDAIIRENGKLEYYLAKYQGQLAGTAILHRLNDEVGNLGSAQVRPAFRKKGVYRSLVAARVQRLAELKVPRAVVLCKQDTSGPICIKLGFQRVYDFKVYEWTPAQEAASS